MEVAEPVVEYAQNVAPKALAAVSVHIVARLWQSLMELLKENVLHLKAEEGEVDYVLQQLLDPYNK